MSLSLASSCDFPASVSLYYPLCIHASTLESLSSVPGSTMGTAPIVPILDTTRALTMVEAFTSGQNSSVPVMCWYIICALSIIIWTDTNSSSSSTIYFAPKYSLRCNCGADLQTSVMFSL